MKKQCKSCGNEYAEDIKFCTNCGNKLEEVKEVPKTQVKQPSEKPVKPPKTPKAVDKILLPIIIIALILSVVAIALPFATGDGTISSGSIGASELASNSVTSSKINDGSIVDNDISSEGISKIADLAINSNNIIGGAIDMKHLSTVVADAITGAADIANNSITSAKIKDYNVDSVDIKNNSVTSNKIPADAVGSSEIATGAVGASEIESESVDTGDIADDAVTYAKMDIKIKYGVKSAAVNDSLVSHGLGSEPKSVIVTPVYEGENYIIHANVYAVDDDSFRIGLWKETISTSVVSEETGGVDVYWVAML